MEIFRRGISIENLWSGLEATSIFKRGLPTTNDLKEPNIARVLRIVLMKDFVTNKMLDSTEDRTTLDLCFRRGWLHAITIQNEVQHVFATPLHRWFVEYYLGTRVADFTPITGQDLLAFTIEVIRGFSRLNLALREEIALNMQRSPEAQFRDEFYRSCHRHSKGSLVSFPEFGDASGKIYFYIPGAEWGVELLRDGDRLEQHSSRFVGDGAYMKTELNDYIILDFRVKPPQKAHPG